MSLEIRRLQSQKTRATIAIVMAATFALAAVFWTMAGLEGSNRTKYRQVTSSGAVDYSLVSLSKQPSRGTQLIRNFGFDALPAPAICGYVLQSAWQANVAAKSLATHSRGTETASPRAPPQIPSNSK